MSRAISLRARLTAIILLPLMVVAALAGLWQLNNARRTAGEVFDNSLLAAALAVANDVAISGGDALSLRTRDILADTSGGRVFYHVYAPDGVIVAGYATPPVGIPRAPGEIGAPTYFNAVYLGQDVRGVRLQAQTQIEGFSGIFTTTVWQDRAVRAAFVRDLVLRSLVTISALVGALALIVWFGVRLGLRPLLDLEEAIARRSGDDLAPIRRAVPGEVAGIVAVLNRLFGQVSKAMTAQSEFISNAAHQLRNPIAGVLSLAEAVERAPSVDEAKRRAADLLAAARETADLSQKLLLLERAKAISPASAFEEVDLGALIDSIADAARGTAPAGVEIDVQGAVTDPVTCDPLMLREALRNAVDNALLHGGPRLSRIAITATQRADGVRIVVADNGRGIPAERLSSARERFRQIASTSQSGLGVSIIDAVAQGHGGQMTLADAGPGLLVTLDLPG